LDYQSNAKKQQEGKTDKPEKVIEKVVTGEVVQKPKTVGHKFKDIFFGGDFKVAMKFVTAEVLFPALRNLMVDTVTKGIERLVYGESSYRRPGIASRYDPRPIVSYNNPLAVRRDPRVPNIPEQGPRSYKANRRDATDIILASREEAELVVERLIDIIDKYDVASVADLNDLLGLPTSHIDNKWGWTYLNNVEIRQIRNGYLIDLPSLEEI
jgi:hypothetical protein